MVTIVKLNPVGQPKIEYHGDITTQLPNGVVLQAFWTMGTRDLGYTVFEPGDRFTEYYYTDRWYNIFEIAHADGTRKGWYCNVTEPALIHDEVIEQIDLLLDVWVDPQGNSLLLDEDEFAADTTLTQRQRIGAQQGLEQLLALLESRREVFASILTHKIARNN